MNSNYVQSSRPSGRTSSYEKVILEGPTEHCFVRQELHNILFWKRIAFSYRRAMLASLTLAAGSVGSWQLSEADLTSRGACESLSLSITHG